MKIRRLKLTIDALSRLPDNERTFLLMAGHMQNEFMRFPKSLLGASPLRRALPGSSLRSTNHKVS